MSRLALWAVLLLAASVAAAPKGAAGRRRRRSVQQPLEVAATAAVLAGGEPVDQEHAPIAANGEAVDQDHFPLPAGGEAADQDHAPITAGFEAAVQSPEPLAAFSAPAVAAVPQAAVLHDMAAGLQDAGVGEAPGPLASAPEPVQEEGKPVNLELHIVNTTVEDVHSSTFGPLSRFLVHFRQELGQKAGVPEQRLSMFGIRGQFSQPDGDAARLLRMLSNLEPRGTARIGQEVVVEIQVLPALPGEPAAKQLAEAVNRQLSSEDSAMRCGSFGVLLAGASVTAVVGPPVARGGSALAAAWSAASSLAVGAAALLAG